LLCALAALLVPRASHAGWSGKQDDRPRSDLEALTDKELFNEAFDVCVQRAFLEKPSADASEPYRAAVADASTYLAAISGVLVERRGGKAPAWMTELADAHKVKECQNAFRTFLAADTTPKERQAPPAQ